MNNETTRTYALYNNQKYFIELKLHNPDGDELILNPGAIFHLVIEDDLHFWPVRGFFIYDNPYEILERKMLSNQQLDDSGLKADRRADLKNVKPYNFRNDGRDYLDITIRPELDETAGSDITIKTLPENLWELKYKCVVYDKEDIEVPDITQKAKKFYFWDVDYQTMLENKIQWSTATSTLNDKFKELGSNFKPSQASDEDRKMYSGDIIKAVLSENGFLVTKNNEKFDKGSTKLFYTFFNDKNISENLNYILDYHLSEKIKNREALDEYDICIFDKDRSTNEFELTPLYKFFEMAGNDPNLPKEYQLEHLYFEGDSETVPSPLKAPLLDELTSTKDVKLGKIKSYQFVDMSAVDNTKMLVTTPVHSYDFKNKTFSINMADSNIENVFNKIKKLYIDNKVLVNGSGEPLLTLNNNKLTNKNISPIYSVRSDKQSILKLGVGNVLYSSLFLNGCLHYQIEGATIRRCGRFVGIDRQSYTDNNLDYKLCGQWFTTCVKHIFFHNTYLNQITAIKNYSYDKLNLLKNTA